MPKLIVAKHSSGKFIDIRRADNGLACDCICVCCNEPLVARQGEKKDWSFAHASGTECSGAIQTALHKAAIQILTDEKKLYVESYDPVLSNLVNLSSYMYEQYYLKKKSYSHNGTATIYEFYSNHQMAERVLLAQRRCSNLVLTFSEAYSERHASGSTRIPDVTAIYDGNTIYIEIVVTNECDQEKISDLRRLGVPVMQIDISSLRTIEFNMDLLRSALINPENNLTPKVPRQWLIKPQYIQDADIVAKEYLSFVDAKVSEIEREEERLREEVSTAARKSQVHVKDVVLNIEQFPMMAIIRIPSNISPFKRSEVNYIFNSLEARQVDSGWSVRGNNICQRIIDVVARVEALEKERNALIESEAEKIRQAEAKEMMLEKNKYMTEQTEIDAEQEALKINIRSALIDEVEARYSYIDDVIWRQDLIDSELKRLGLF